MGNEKPVLQFLPSIREEVTEEDIVLGIWKIFDMYGFSPRERAGVLRTLYALVQQRAIFEERGMKHGEDKEIKQEEKPGNPESYSA